MSSKMQSTKKLVNEKSVMAVIRASRPSFRNSHDKVAFVVHASFLSAGYFLNATGTPAFSHDALTSSSTDEVGTDQWNEFAYNYAFVYINPQRGLKKVLVKCLAENEKLIVDAWSGYGSTPFHLEIDVRDYVVQERKGKNYSSHFKDLRCLLRSIYKVILSNFSDSEEECSSTQTSTSSIEHKSPETSGSSTQGSSSSTQPSCSSFETSRGVDEDNIKKLSAKVFILEHRQLCSCLGSVPAVHPSVGSYFFPELSSGTYRHRNDFGYERGRRTGQLYPWFFGGIGGAFGFLGGQRVNQDCRYSALGFEPNQPSMLWWHWWRVGFPQSKTEEVVMEQEENKNSPRIGA